MGVGDSPLGLVDNNSTVDLQVLSQRGQEPVVGRAGEVHERRTPYAGHQSPTVTGHAHTPPATPWQWDDRPATRSAPAQHAQYWGNSAGQASSGDLATEGGGGERALMGM